MSKPIEKIIPISDLQSKARHYVDQVRDTDEPVIVTRRGRAAAVLVSYESYEGLLATQDEMSYPDWKEKLERAEKDSREGRVIDLEEYKRKRKSKSKAKR